MKKVLILCTGNSCRSQKAHGILKNLSPNTEVYSAGVETHGVNPFAIDAMNRIGIDISNHTSNNISEYDLVSFDYIITVCDSAKERCPIFPSTAIKFHKDFYDPSKFEGGLDEKNKRFDKARNEIQAYLKSFIKAYL